MQTHNAPIDEDWTVNEVVGAHPATLPILGRYGIDTCCGGLKNLRTVAEAHEIELERLLDELRAAVKPAPKILDVRPDLRAGREPFATIMAAATSLKPGQELILLVDFEPVPLYRVLGGQGFEHRAERADDGSWKISFGHAG